MTTILAKVCAGFVTALIAFVSLSLSPSWADNSVSVAEMYPQNLRGTPIPGGAHVEWDAVDYIGTHYFDGGHVAPAVVFEYYVVSSYDPATKSGYRSCRVSSSETSCEITGLVNGVSYTFTARSNTRILASPHPTWQGEAPQWSNYSPPSMPVTPCCSLPLAPQQVKASVVDDNLDVTWQAPTDWGGSTELQYEVSTTPASTTCKVAVLACRLERLNYGIDYVVNVTASNAAGISQSASSSARYAIPKSVPDAPSLVKARYGKPGTAKISWSVPSRDGGSTISGYLATASPGGATCKVSGKTRTCTITGLSGGRSYAFSVKAFNTQGTSQSSVPAVAGVLVNPASKPRDVQAKVVGNAVTITWQPPTSNGGGKLVSYVVRSAPDAGTCTTQKRTCTLRNLAPGGTYRFTVAAINTAGRGLLAQAAPVTVPAPPAPAPPPVTATSDKPTQQLS